MPAEDLAAQDGQWRRFGEGTPERAALQALSTLLGTTIRPASIALPSGGRTEAEGLAADGSVVVQLVLNTGTFKSHHRNKVMADMFKLVWLRTALTPSARCILCISPTILPAFSSVGWVRAAATDLKIDIYVWDGTSITVLDSL